MNFPAHPIRKFLVSFVAFSIGLGIVDSRPAEAATKSAAKQAEGSQAQSKAESTPPAKASAKKGAYTVAAGDTLTKLSGRFDVTVAELRTANPSVDPHQLRIGQSIKIPRSSKKLLPAGLRARPERLKLRPLFAKWAGRNNIPADLLEATTWLESGWNQSRVSSTGAIGIGQIMPKTATFIADELIGQPVNYRKTEDNIRMSARYLRFLLKLHKGDSTKALYSYYQGAGSVQRNGLYDDTIDYARSVQALRLRFKADLTGRTIG